MNDQRIPRVRWGIFGAANIALEFPESSGIDVNVLIATGLVLFFLTFVVNFAARAFLARRKDFSGAN